MKTFTSCHANCQQSHFAVLFSCLAIAMVLDLSQPDTLWVTFTELLSKVSSSCTQLCTDYATCHTTAPWKYKIIASCIALNPVPKPIQLSLVRSVRQFGGPEKCILRMYFLFVRRSGKCIADTCSRWGWKTTSGPMVSSRRTQQTRQEFYSVKKKATAMTTQVIAKFSIFGYCLYFVQFLS